MQNSHRVLGALLVTVMAATLAPGQTPPQRRAVRQKTVQVQQTTGPKAMREFRGVWVATVSNIDWPSSRGLTTEQQKAELIAICDRSKELNLNAIVFQGRPSCDALYESKLEPWAEYLTGEQGKPPEPYYDPMQMWVDEAHKRGLELHVWFNPYRAKQPSARGALAPNHLFNTHPDMVKEYGKHLWLDPGEKFVQDHSVAVMMDVVKRYDIDGVHMDDYFYPYKEKDKNGKIIDFPDEPSWNKYKAGGGKLSRDDWRRSNVDVFVERLYKNIKAEKPWVKLGISPFGIWQPGYPPQIKGFNQYTELYADAKKWLNEGWVDYFTPQLYWRISAAAQSYPYLLRWWLQENTHDRHIWPGLYTSKISGEANGFNVDEIVNQIVITRFLNANGNVHFSMKPFLSNKHKLNDALTTGGGVYEQPALVPATPWLGDDAPGRPRIEFTSQAAEDTTSTASADTTSTASAETSGTAAAESIAKPSTPAKAKLGAISWKPTGSKAWLWALFLRKGDAWTLHVLPGEQTSFDLEADSKGTGPAEVSLLGVDRNGNEGPRANLKLDKQKPTSDKPKETYGQVQ
ncbi:MAG: glycoside hydrolase family 10 protein [Candidatus Sumerlaeaceae bacterium]